MRIPATGFPQAGNIIGPMERTFFPDALGRPEYSITEVGLPGSCADETTMAVKPLVQDFTGNKPSMT